MPKDYFKLFNDIIDEVSDSVQDEKDIPAIPKAYFSLSEIRYECPTCEHIPGGIIDCGIDYRTGDYYTNYKDRCPYCGQAIKWDWDEIDRKAKKSKKYREMELKKQKELNKAAVAENE